MKEAKVCRVSEVKPETLNLQCRNGHWHLRATVNGIKIAQSLRTTDLEEARLKRNAILGPMQCLNDERNLLHYVERQLKGISVEEDAMVKERSKGPRLDSAWKTWERDPSRQQCRDTQLESHRKHWGEFLEWMRENHPDIQHCRLVSRAVCQEWASDVWATSRTINSYNKRICSVRYVFSSVCRIDEQMRQPMENIHKKKEIDAVGKEPFTDEELRLIFGCRDAEFVRLCAIGLYTTLRFSSARKLRWEDFSEDLSLLTAVHEKTGADATQVTAPELREILGRVPADGRHGYVCPGYAECMKSPAVCKIRAALQALGIQTAREIEGMNGKMRRVCIKGFHSFRHTAITLALRNGAGVAQVKRLAGHASEGMQARYTHLGAEDAGKANALIGKFW